MKHLMAVWTYWSHILDWVDLSCFSFEGMQWRQVMHVNVSITNLTVCEKEIESAD